MISDWVNARCPLQLRGVRAMGRSSSDSRSVEIRPCGMASNGLGVLATTPSCRTARKVADRALRESRPPPFPPFTLKAAARRWRCRKVRPRQSPFTRYTARPGRVEIRS
jgi:hypothetical protein